MTKKTNKNDIETAIINKIKNKFGAGSIMRLDDSLSDDTPVWETRTRLDEISGIGGIPQGRIIELYGGESTGKSTLCQHIAAEVQAQGGKAAYIDVEHSSDTTWMKKIGVDTSKIWFSQPDSGEQALTIVEDLIPIVDIIIVDSIAALTPQAELDGEMTDQQMGLQARMMGKALRKITSKLSKHHCTVIFINQLREKIGAMGYGDPTITPGGRALKFYASMRFSVSKVETLKRGVESIGVQIKIKCVKNKMAPPFKECFIGINFKEGKVTNYSNKEADAKKLFDEAFEIDVLTKDKHGYHFENYTWKHKPEVVKDFQKEKIAKLVEAAMVESSAK